MEDLFLKRTKKADKFYKRRIKRIAEQLKGKKLTKTAMKAIYKRKKLKKDKPASEIYIFGVSLDRWRG